MSTSAGEIIFAVEEAPEGGFLAHALGHDIFTEADTMDALREAVRDAVRCHFEEDDRPKVIRLHFVREERLARQRPTRRMLRSVAIAAAMATLERV